MKTATQNPANFLLLNNSTLYVVSGVKPTGDYIPTGLPVKIVSVVSIGKGETPFEIGSELRVMSGEAWWMSGDSDAKVLRDHGVKGERLAQVKSLLAA